MNDHREQGEQTDLLSENTTAKRRNTLTLEYTFRNKNYFSWYVSIISGYDESNFASWVLKLN